ncbi:MAG: hypothetical protein LBG79_01905 [Spirochaetaceae bacterium]|nr:hypothetical protein [Spirochaetaceae bacterium]
MDFRLSLDKLRVRQWIEAAFCFAIAAVSFLRFRGVYICLISLGLLSIIAIGDWYFSGIVRRTIVFYALENNAEIVEERFVAQTGDSGGDIRAFVEEAVLGPSRWDAAPLFGQRTVLESLFLRDGVVFICLSEEAALPVRNDAKGSLLMSLASLTRDIKRNFSRIAAVRYFVAGSEIPLEGS